MEKIAVFTSGGDSPGMNAAIRAVVRTAIHYDLEVMGIMHGYDGMIHGEFIPLSAKSVANIIQRGGTVLKTSRSKDFLSEAGRKKAFEQLQQYGVDGLVAIGGDGTFRGAVALHEEHKVPIIGIPGTIDNDLHGTDFTLGYDTAINTVVDAVDKIRDTAESHERLFFVEVMGRDAGLIALRSGIGSGAVAILMPEMHTDIDGLIKQLNSVRKNKTSKIVIVAEGDEAGGALEISKKVKEKLPQYDMRVSILGHIQRGGNPTCMDRVLASRLGFAAVEALKDGRQGEMVGLSNNKLVYTSFKSAVKHLRALDENMIRMVDILAS